MPDDPSRDALLGKPAGARYQLRGPFDDPTWRQKMTEAIYCFDTATVRFAIFPDGPKGDRFIAAIAEDPLRDLFGARGGGDSLVQAYLQNAPLIEARAIERYRQLAGGEVILETADFDIAHACA